MSAALAGNAAIAEVEAFAPDADPADARAWPDVIILDPSAGQSPRGQSVAERYPDALVLRLRDEEPEVEAHVGDGTAGFVRRRGLEEIAPVVVALASLSSGLS
jgi:hypothetical protein